MLDPTEPSRRQHARGGTQLTGRRASESGCVAVQFSDGLPKTCTQLSGCIGQGKRCSAGSSQWPLEGKEMTQDADHTTLQAAIRRFGQAWAQRDIPMLEALLSPTY